MGDDFKIKRWNWKDKALLWGLVVMSLLNLVIGLLTLGPDLLHW